MDKFAHAGAAEGDAMDTSGIMEQCTETAQAAIEALRKLIETIQAAAGELSEAMEELASMAEEIISMDPPRWPRPQAARIAATAALPVMLRQYIPP